MTRTRRIDVLRLAFWSFALIAFVMAVLPKPPQLLPGSPSDKVQHMTAFLVLGGLASFAYPRASPVFLGAALSLFGAFIELVQFIPALQRDSDPIDWLADTAAAALILMFLHWLRARRSNGLAEKS